MVSAELASGLSQALLLLHAPTAPATNMLTAASKKTSPSLCRWLRAANTSATRIAIMKSAALALRRAIMGITRTDEYAPKESHGVHARDIWGSSDNLPNHAILDMLTLVRSSASWR
jgi:hypothetical protein